MVDQNSRVNHSEVAAPQLQPVVGRWECRPSVGRASFSFLNGKPEIQIFFFFFNVKSPDFSILATLSDIF